MMGITVKTDLYQFLSIKIVVGDNANNGEAPTRANGVLLDKTPSKARRQVPKDLHSRSYEFGFYRFQEAVFVINADGYILGYSFNLLFVKDDKKRSFCNTLFR